MTAKKLRQGGTESRLARAAVTLGEHPVALIFVVALIARVAIALLVHTVFAALEQPDAVMYHVMAEGLAEDTTSNWDDFTLGLSERVAAFLYPLRFVYEVFWPSMLIGSLYVALLGAAAAALATKLAIAVAKAWAIAAGLILALLPSQVFWASVTLKDTMVWLLLIATAVAVSRAAESSPRALIGYGAAVTVLLFLLAYTRQHTFVVACWALVAASFVGTRRLRIPRAVGAVVLCVAIPWVAGLGPAGWTLIKGNDLEEMRVLNAERAESAFVPTPTTERVEELREEARAAQARGDEDEAERLQQEADEIAALEERSDRSADADGSGLAPNIAHLPRGIAVMLLAPYPWQRSNSLTLNLARVESIVWYPLLVLAAIGLTRVRRFARVMTFPIVTGTSMLLVYALTEGNVGTAYRHRGDFVWAIVLLAGLGMYRLLGDRKDEPTTGSATELRSPEPADGRSRVGGR